MIDGLGPAPPPYSRDAPLGESNTTQRELANDHPAPRINSGHGTLPFYRDADGEVGAFAATLAARQFIEHPMSPGPSINGSAQHNSLPSSQSGTNILPDSQIKQYLGEEIVDIPTKRPVPSGLPSASLVTSLAIQAIARHVEQRGGDVSCAGRRQYRGCTSRRRCCSRKKLGPALSADHAAETEKNDTIHPTVPPPSPRGGCSTSHSAQNSDSTNLLTLSKLMNDTNLTRQARGTSVTIPSHPEASISSADSKAMVANQPTFPNPPTLLLNRPERRALRSDLKALKHEIKAAARKIRTERKEEAQSKEKTCCGAMSFQERKDLRAWKRECLGEVRKVARSVRGAGRSCA